MNFMSSWLSKFADNYQNKIEHKAVDKLPDDELNGLLPNMFPGMNAPGQDPAAAGGAPGGAPPPAGPPAMPDLGTGGAMAMDPSMMDPSMMMPPPEEEEEPLTWDNKYLVELNNGGPSGPKFIVELTPRIVTKQKQDEGNPGDLLSSSMSPAAPPGGAPGSNPNADPQALLQWMAKNFNNTEKPFSNTEQGAVDPLTQEEEGINNGAPSDSPSSKKKPPISKTQAKNFQHIKIGNRFYHPNCFELFADSGLEKVAAYRENILPYVDKKTCSFCETGFELKKQADFQDVDNSRPQKEPGIDRSNAYYPCKVCSNYIPENNACAQGLDVEKVQAAGSCSWLNSTLSPFLDKGHNLNPTEDKETYKKDISDSQGSGTNYMSATNGRGMSA